MFKKKTQLIIFICLVSVLIVILVFSLIIKNKDKSQEAGNIKNEETRLEELKKIHSELSDELLGFYQATAKRDKNIIEPCLGRADEKDCVASVAFIRGDINLCHDLDIDNGELAEECIKDITVEIADVEVSKCDPFFGDDFFNCLMAIFSLPDGKINCANLQNKETQQICEQAFYYQEEAYLKYDRKLCANIKNEKLNQYCLKNIIDEAQDSDGDGLTDLDEINKYGTHYLFADTDGDGYSDGEEVANGYNPRGEGRLEE